MSAQARYRSLLLLALWAPWTPSHAASQRGPDERESVHHHQAGHSMPTHHHVDHAEHDAPVDPRIPVPALTDEDRAAVFIDGRGHVTHAPAIMTFLLLDQLEWQGEDGKEAYAWDISGWIGSNVHRLLILSEGERHDAETEAAELQLLSWHAIGPWWNAVVGVRQDFKPGSPQTWATLGIEGTLLYGLEAAAALYLGEGGQTSARFKGEYDIPLTHRLILQPSAEINLYGRDDRQRAVGSGLADAELGLRLRYEIRREFAPYIGVSWTRRYGKTADFASDIGADTQDTRLVLGFRAWF